MWHVNEESIRNFVSTLSNSTISMHTSFLGAALPGYKSVLQRKKSRGSLKPTEVKQLTLLKAIQMDYDAKATADIPLSQRLCGRGNLVCLDEDHLPFAASAFKTIASHVNQDSYKKYGKDMVKVASTCVTCDKSILAPLMQLGMHC